ncbi:fatty acid desaturase [Bernardetia litoralis DSM 6794]|uniref:Fatty acid desaturase n=1 Tax=Bernardetia litoralis (strain ATCC 23117 / DSM 6794 / NBRC 15988 / NCIMB 1366 / Fx l1 / Sio-4) TaxID=880071 RepID=I4AP27_BERLS|nr:fatty acid desaturase [Bernardetia litoralis]AFM05712.1 fatty acid desaturase [Bernardetia litoralis DSM 6794]
MKKSYFDKDLMKSLSFYAVEDKTKSWYFLIEIVFILTALEILIFNIEKLIFQFFLSVIIGLLFIRFFVIYHDTLHKAIFTTSKFARFLIKFFGILVLNPPSVWERSHNHHHKNNSKMYASSVGSFPILSKNQYYSLSKKEQFIYIFTRHPLNIFFGYFTVFLLGMCLIPFIKSPKKHFDGFFAVLSHFFLSILLIHFNVQFFFFGFWFPLFFSSMLGAYLFYVQHNFPAIKLTTNKKWDYFFAALYSTSFFKMSSIMHWFTGNIGYHHIHHLNAQVPFYNLPKAMNNIPKLQNPITITWSLKDASECFKLFYFDEEQQKMIYKEKSKL